MFMQVKLAKHAGSPLSFVKCPGTIHVVSVC